MHGTKEPSLSRASYVSKFKGRLSKEDNDVSNKTALRLE